MPETDRSDRSVPAGAESSRVLTTQRFDHGTSVGLAEDLLSRSEDYAAKRGCRSDSRRAFVPEAALSEAREDLAEAFVELSDAPADDSGLADFLRTLTTRCVELLPVDVAGILISQRNGLAPAGAATEPGVPGLLELQLPSGPSAECIQARRPLVNLDLLAERRRWPEFVRAALEAGFRSLHVLPMRRRDDVIGALNLFGSGSDPLPDGDLRIGQALADVATTALQRCRQLRNADQLAKQLQGALRSRIVIEQAKGVLAERGRLGMDHAFERLRGYARSHNRRLYDVATAVVRGTMDKDELLR